MAIDPKWHFAEHRPDQAVRNPTGSEFFSDEAVDRPAQALVREAIQNSMDAAVPGESVCVRVYVSGERHALSANRAAHWLGGAWPHLTADNNGLRNVPARPPACPFIVIEDFGTSGLTGDIAEARLSGENRFFAFFRAEGVSSKEGDRGGRWGIGKTIFLRSSTINTLIALTVQHEDKRCLLMGRSVLKHHVYTDRDFTPDGWFGSPRAGDQFVLPIEDAAIIEQFVRDFHLARSEAASGLSVVIPYCDQNITVADFRSAVLREYYYPILAGRLTVILHDGAADKSLRLDSAALRKVIGDESFKIDAGLRAAMELALWSLEPEAAEQRVTLMRAGESGPAEWSESLIPESQSERLGAAYQDGQRIAIRVPVKVRYTGGKSVDTWFDVYIRQDLEDRGHLPFYIRNGIIIPKVRERQVRGHRILALVVIEDGGLGTPLGDAEPPSHTHWSAETEKFVGKYEYGKQLLEFVANAPRQIAELLSRAQDERDVYSLSQFFPHPGEEKKGPGPRPGPEPPPPPPPPPRGKPVVEISALKSGFVVTLTADGKTSPPDSIRIQMAYDREAGNPLKKYNVADFVLADLGVTIQGAEELARSSNEILIRPIDPSCRIQVTGFDERRDVFVRALPSKRSADP